MTLGLLLSELADAASKHADDWVVATLQLSGEATVGGGDATAVDGWDHGGLVWMRVHVSGVACSPWIAGTSESSGLHEHRVRVHCASV